MKVCFGAHNGCAIYKLVVFCFLKHVRDEAIKVEQIRSADPKLLRQAKPQPAASARAVADDLTDNDVLVDAQWLEPRLASSHIRLIGMGQSHQQYLSAHIPGEVFVDWKSEMHDAGNPGMFNLPSRQQIESLLSRLGVTPETTIVLTDNMSSRLSARMFWTLRCYGHEPIKVLNGGRREWIQSGRAFTTEVPDVPKTDYVVTSENHEIRADLAQIETRLANGDEEFLLDSRPVEHYSGESPGAVYHTGREHSRRGHIPGARHIAWTDNFSDHGRFKSTDELRRMYAEQGFNGTGELITYCNEGLHAAAPWFVLTQLLGYKNVRLYDESIAEWSKHAELPMEIDSEFDDDSSYSISS